MIGSWLTGPIAQAILQGYSAKLASQNTSQQIAANLQQAQELTQSSVVISEDNRWFPLVRWGFACPFVIYNFKIIVWDRMFHLGVTDMLSPDLIGLEKIIVGAYFGYAALAGFHPNKKS